MELSDSKTPSRWMRFLWLSFRRTAISADRLYFPFLLVKEFILEKAFTAKFLLSSILVAEYTAAKFPFPSFLRGRYNYEKPL